MAHSVYNFKWTFFPRKEWMKEEKTKWNEEKKVIGKKNKLLRIDKQKEGEIERKIV